MDTPTIHFHLFGVEGPLKKNVVEILTTTSWTWSSTFRNPSKQQYSYRHHTQPSVALVAFFSSLSTTRHKLAYVYYYFQLKVDSCQPLYLLGRNQIVWLVPVYPQSSLQDQVQRNLRVGKELSFVVLRNILLLNSCSRRLVCF